MQLNTDQDPSSELMELEQLKEELAQLKARMDEQALKGPRTSEPCWDGQWLTDDQLEAFSELARLDDWHIHMVGSDVRQMIGDLQRARRALAEKGQ